MEAVRIRLLSILFLIGELSESPLPFGVDLEWWETFMSDHGLISIDSEIQD